MVRYHLIVVGKMKSSSVFYPAFAEYEKRLGTLLRVTEIGTATAKKENEQIRSKIDPDFPVFMLDEKGKPSTSRKLATTFQSCQGSLIQLVIGGADGLDHETKSKAQELFSFGMQTWPHMMVRVMLAEQIYRAEQIMNNHPYHRD